MFSTSIFNAGADKDIMEFLGDCIAAIDMLFLGVLDAVVLAVALLLESTGEIPVELDSKLSFSTGQMRLTICGIWYDKPR